MVTKSISSPTEKDFGISISEKQKIKIPVKMKNKVQLFEEKKVRTVWNEETEEWYFSVTDVVDVLTDTDRPRKYWNDL